MIEREAEFVAFLRKQPLGDGTRESYLSYLHSASTALGTAISPSLLPSEQAVDEVAGRLDDGKIPPKTIANWCSAMRMYVAMLTGKPGIAPKKDSLTMFELGHLAWPILTRAAKEHRTLNYIELAEAIGYRGARVTRFALEPIQNLCLEKGWPPLTSIVVNKVTGLPGPGFIAWPGDMKDAHAGVFEFDWTSKPVPFAPADRRRFAEGIGTSLPVSFEVPDSEVVVNGRGPYQDHFRSILMHLYGRRCALCDTRLPSALIAAHIVPWAADRKNRLNPRNGILFCRTHDAAFEADLFRISVDYRIVLNRCDPAVLGEDLHDFLARRTSATLRLPGPSSMPDEDFLNWRLDNCKADAPKRELQANRREKAK